MSPEKQRIAIAWALGWKVIPAENCITRLIGPDSSHVASAYLPGLDLRHFLGNLPDYPGSLDAMRGVLLSIPANQGDDFQEVLEEIARPLGGPAQAKRKAVFTASASQLAEAYIKFRNLWEGPL